MLEPHRPISLDEDGHSLTRYIERWHPHMHPRDARKQLEAQLITARFIECESGNDQSIWRLQEGVLIVVDDHGVVKTVLPREAQKPEGRR